MAWYNDNTEDDTPVTTKPPQAYPKRQYSIAQLERWLKRFLSYPNEHLRKDRNPGWVFLDATGKPLSQENLAIYTALSLLRDPEDGIYTFTQRQAGKPKMKKGEHHD